MMRQALGQLLAAASLLIAACGGPAPEGGQGEEAVGENGRILSAPAPNEDGITRVLVYHDMEGLAGQDDPRTYLSSKPEYYPRGREWLTADVNAVIAGLFDAGADEIHVTDAHGSGSQEPDLLLDRLDPRAEMVFRDQPYRPYIDLVEPGVYDAVAMVAMHSKTGSGGFAAHTFNPGTAVQVNGMWITETEVIAYAWGDVGVPVIFASGDDRLADDLTTMPWIEFVTTKKATSASTAELYPVDSVRAELLARARQALENWEEARAMTLTKPITAAVGAVPPADLSMLRGVPGIRYEDNTVTFEAPDYAAAYDGFTALIRVANEGYSDLWREVAAARPDGQALGQAYRDLLFGRWWDFESGRWTPPPPGSPAPRRYHGSN